MISACFRIPKDRRIRCLAFGFGSTDSTPSFVSPVNFSARCWKSHANHVYTSRIIVVYGGEPPPLPIRVASRQKVSSRTHTEVFTGGREIWLCDPVSSEEPILRCSYNDSKAASKRRLTDPLLNETFHLVGDQRGAHKELLGSSVEHALRLAHHTAPNSMKDSILKRARFPKPPRLHRWDYTRRNPGVLRLVLQQRRFRRLG
jgi:hypothetical protein